MSKLKVLLLAEAANPDWTSVPLLGWLHAKALSTICEVHLVTQLRNKESIEKQGWVEGVDFTAIDTEILAKPIHRLSTFLRGGKNVAWTIDTALQSLTYPLFEYLVWKKFKHDLISKHFDVVHRITPVSPTSPSLIAKKLRHYPVPFILGPINGGVKWPQEYLSLKKKEREWLTSVRNFYKLLPGSKNCRKYSSAIIAGSKDTYLQIPEKLQYKTFYIPENGIDSNRFFPKEKASYQLPLNVVFIGRLVPYKGADMAVEAIAEFCKKGLIKFHIFGGGPEMESLQRLVAKLDVSSSVHFHGFVDNNKLKEHLHKMDLLIFPSVREFGGGCVLESMASGIVPLVVDYAGPAELVTQSCGYKVAMLQRSYLIEQIRIELSKILVAPEQLAEKRVSCLDRISKYYTWERKAEQDLAIYNWCLGKGPKPSYQFDYFEK